jgi:hypothetical protein
MTGALSQEVVTEAIRGAFPDVHVDTTTADLFFFAGEERKFPFATLITHDDAYDSHSRLDRPGVFRLCLGVSRESFQKLFPPSDADRVHDFTALDTLMPHPVYGKMSWLCVLNPSPETFQSLRPLLQESYDLQAHRSARR